MQKHILVVDDEPQIRELLGLYLSKNGYRISTAANSVETMESVQADPVDVIILDIGLAGEDGLGLLTRLKEANPHQRVIMLTGMGFVEDVIQESVAKGADGYVNKALPLTELLMAIDRVLNETSDPGHRQDEGESGLCERAA